MSTQPIEERRRAIARLLPEAMDRALGSYRAFTNQVVSNDSKAFKDHHMAGRMALSHLEALLRLARSTTADQGRNATGMKASTLDPAKLATTVAEAQQALADLRRARDDSDDI